MIMVGVLIGFLFGILINDTVQKSTDPAPKEIAMIISFPGEIFLRMLKLIILPLIVSSIIVAVAVLDSKSTGKLGKRAIIYYMSTTVLAVILGIVLVSSIKPGATKTAGKSEEQQHVEAVHSIFDLIRYLMFIISVIVHALLNKTFHVLFVSLFSLFLLYTVITHV